MELELQGLGAREQCSINHLVINPPPETDGMEKSTFGPSGSSEAAQILRPRGGNETGGTHSTGRGCMECTPRVRPRSSPPPSPGLKNEVQLGPTSGGARSASRELATAVVHRGRDAGNTRSELGLGRAREGGEGGRLL